MKISISSPKINEVKGLKHTSTVKLTKTKDASDLNFQNHSQKTAPTVESARFEAVAQCTLLWLMPDGLLDKNGKFLLYKTNRLHFPVYVIDHRRHVKNKSTSPRVILFCSLHTVTSSVIYYNTHTQINVIYLLTI